MLLLSIDIVKSNMKKNECLRKISFHEWSPRELWTPAMTVLIAMMIGKVLLFDILWCAETTWSGLLNVRLYVHAILLSFLLSVPIGIFRRKWLQIGFMMMADIGLAMLLCLAGRDFLQVSVIRWLLIDVLPEPMTGCAHSFVWYWMLLSLTTFVSFFICLKYPGRVPVSMLGKIQYCGYLFVWTLVAWMLA